VLIVSNPIHPCQTTIGISGDFAGDKFVGIFELKPFQSIRRPEAWFCQGTPFLTDSGRGQREPSAGEAFVSEKVLARRFYAVSEICLSELFYRA